MISNAADRRAAITLARLWPRLERRLNAAAQPAEWEVFAARLQRHFADLFHLLLPLYGTQYDFFYHLEELLVTAAEHWLQRSPALKALDREREEHPLWFQGQRMLGGVLYVDLFAGTLNGVRAHIPYFVELGLTYLHLMPLFPAPAGNSDGGYAVSSYHEVNPALGTTDDLIALAGELRAHGISLVLDFVLNHTSDEHPWAQQAQAGDPAYSDYYYLFPDRTLPDRYGAYLRDIFPEQRPGSFTYRPEIDRWVWTTFNSFQWDLNYSNPAVFTAMAGEMLTLANDGVDVLRFDALAFIWKTMGTDCENRPEAHLLIRAFNAIVRIAAPSMIFKSEAIVHPDAVATYISPQECQLSYNPLLMALLWETLATREVRLLKASMAARLAIDPHCAWVNYVRSHDDIGWTFDDSDAAQVGIPDSFGHRRFLNAFYTGRFPGSFARGLPFQENPRTGDARISGTCASLAGLEQAVHNADTDEIDLSVRRILLLYSVVLSIGGIPLLYLGDEVGTLNNYRFYDDSAKADDSRWVHRPATDWGRLERRHDPATLEGRVYSGISHLARLRRSLPVLAGAASETEIIETANAHVFGYARCHEGERLLVLANVSEHAQEVAANVVRLYGLGYRFTDLIAGAELTIGDEPLVLAPYRVLWLVVAAV